MTIGKGTRRQQDRPLAKDNDEAPAEPSASAYGQPRFHAPRGYTDSIWMIAANFTEAAKYHGHTLSQGLPVLHDLVYDTVRLEMGQSGWPFLVNETIGRYWRILASRKPEHMGYADHWAEMYPVLREIITDRPKPHQAVQLALKEAGLREKIETGEIGIIRRQK